MLSKTKWVIKQSFMTLSKSLQKEKLIVVSILKLY